MSYYARKVRFHITEAEFNGRLARVNFEGLITNPYPSCSQEWRDFAKGWVYADKHPGVPRWQDNNVSWLAAGDCSSSAYI